MPLKKLREFLDAEQVKYVLITHSPAFTSSAVAASAHIPGREMVKTVMVKVDGDMAMAVLPSMDHVDIQRLRDLTGAHKVRIAQEDEFGELFPNCEIGAMPPFGNLWNQQVFVDPALAKVDQIAFNAGSHTELMQIHWDDFERLVRPQVLDLHIH